jgi:hypothetical protein
MEYKSPIDVDFFSNRPYQTNALLVNNGRGIEGLQK